MSEKMSNERKVCITNEQKNERNSEEMKKKKFEFLLNDLSPRFGICLLLFICKFVEQMLSCHYSHLTNKVKL